MRVSNGGLGFLTCKLQYEGFNLGCFQAGGYRYRSLIEGLYT